MSDLRLRSQGLGLPRGIPSDAEVLWRGRPNFEAVAIEVCRMRIVAIYFAVLIATDAVLAWIDGWSRLVALESESKLLLLAALTLATLAVIAYAICRTTRYVLLDRCLVMRFGVALSATLVIPLAAISEVGLRVGPRGGDVAVGLAQGQNVAYFKLWPHARPGRWIAAQPMLRGLKDAGVIAPMLARLVGAARGSIA